MPRSELLKDAEKFASMDTPTIQTLIREQEQIVDEKLASGELSQNISPQNPWNGTK